MREIKFRAWDKEFKKYIGSAEYVIDPYSGAVADIGGYEILSVNHDALLEQFIGLHDKNGKEIYEGDIVKVYGFSENTVGEVIYEVYYFTIDGFYEPAMDNPEMAFSERIYEVIGNIHENPELIEELNK